MTNSEIQTILVIVESFNENIILGENFLSINNAILDSKKNQIK